MRKEPLLQVRKIERLEDFIALRQNWEAVYAADPHAHIFVSWLWLRGWFQIASPRWFILAARPDAASPYVAFLPLQWRGWRIGGVYLTRELHLGGKPLASYTGFLCRPEFEEAALHAFARHIQQAEGWDRLQMSEVLDSRLPLFLAHFSPSHFEVQQQHSMPSLYIPLPGNWQAYTQNALSAATRRNLKRRTRQLENLEKFHTTSLQPERLAHDTGVLMSLWQQRWGPKPLAAQHRAMMHHFAAHNGLWGKILWDGQTPVSAQFALTDPLKKTFYTYLTGYNPQYARLSPGLVMVGYSIREAIEMGFRKCDFLLGADPYKLSFGSKQRGSQKVTITRRRLRSRSANAAISAVEQGSNISKTALGKMKRTTVVKQLWLRWQTLQKRGDR